MDYEQVKEVETLDEMRKELYRFSRYDPLTREMMTRADYSGFSGEDRYLIIAYYALKENAQFKKDMLSDLMRRAIVPLIPEEQPSTNKK